MTLDRGRPQCRFYFQVHVRGEAGAKVIRVRWGYTELGGVPNRHHNIRSNDDKIVTPTILKKKMGSLKMAAERLFTPRGVRP